MELKNFELPKFHIDDANGSPLSGGKVYFYEAGTSTLKNTYADKYGNTVNSNPVVLDSRGEADIFIAYEAYKILVTDSDGVVIFTRDDYNPALQYPLVEVMPGTGITVDNTDPQHPVVATSGVLEVMPGTGITVDNTDPQHPVVASSGVLEVIPGTGITVDNTDPQNPVVASYSVLTVEPGTGITVDNTNLQHPVVAFNTATRIRAYGSTAQSLAAGVITKVIFDTVEKDSLGEFSSSAFTASNPGRYLVSVNLLLDCTTGGEQHILRLHKNGAEICRLDHKRLGYSGLETSMGCVDIDMETGDYIEIFISSSIDSSTSPGSMYTFMTITRTL